MNTQSLLSMLLGVAFLSLLACKKNDGGTDKVLAKVTTNEISSIRAASAQGGGNVISQGNSLVSARGICWSTTPNPTVDNTTATSGAGSGSFIATLSNLIPSTTYYVRSYAVNEQGIAYGNQVSFTTEPQPASDFWIINSRLFQTNGIGAIWAPGTRSLGAISITQGGIFTVTFKEKPSSNGSYKVRDATSVRQADLEDDECIIIIASPGVPNLFSSAENAGSPVSVTVNNGKIIVGFTDVDFNYMEGSILKPTKGSAVVPEK
jgi:hypothetical protein